MTITDYAKSRVSLLLGGSFIGSVGQMIIGTGSSTVSTTDTSLVTSTDRQNTTTITYPLARKLTWQFDWNSVEMSGTQLSEFGLIQSGGGLTGSIWSRDVIPALIFDGTNELRIEFNAEVF